MVILSFTLYSRLLVNLSFRNVHGTFVSEKDFDCAYNLTIISNCHRNIWDTTFESFEY